MGMSGPAAVPITQKVHSKTSASKEAICETCKKPIGQQCKCSSKYIHVRGGN